MGFEPWQLNLAPCFTRCVSARAALKKGATCHIDAESASNVGAGDGRISGRSEAAVEKGKTEEKEEKEELKRSKEIQISAWDVV